MNSHVFKPGALPDAPPGSLEIGEMRARQLAGDNPWIVVVAGKGGQDGACLGSERDDPSARLGIPQLDVVVLHVFPAQELDLGQPAACQGDVPVFVETLN